MADLNALEDDNNAANISNIPSNSSINHHRHKHKHKHHIDTDEEDDEDDHYQEIKIISPVKHHHGHHHGHNHNRKLKGIERKDEWPKLATADRAHLRKRLARELQQHHLHKKKKAYKLEKNRLAKDRKIKKYEKELIKLEKTLKKHGVKYLGPPEEDQIWRLMSCLSYRQDRTDTYLDGDENLTMRYEKR